MKSVLLVVSVLRSAEARSLVSAVVRNAGHKLVHAPSCEQAQILLENGVEPDLVIVEPSTSFDLNEILQAASQSAVCVVCGAGEHVRRIGAAAGVDLFLDLPVSEKALLAILERVCTGERSASSPEPGNHQTEKSGAGPVLEELSDGRYFLAAAPSTLKIYRQVKLLADVDAPVLILGESGTGKEVIAHLIHKHSRRSEHRFVNVNCAALPADLLESELFGYQKGAFTGAIKDKPGKFELANRGTLLLDEIAEMSAQMQAKLLHVLQDGQFSRLGAP